MALNTQLPNVTVNAQGDAKARLEDNGYVRVYSGAEPATADTALSTQVLLAELRFSATSAPATSGGVITYSALTPGPALATGTASFYRTFKSDGTTVTGQGNVGTASANMLLGTTSIVIGASVASSSFTHTVAKSTAGL